MNSWDTSGYVPYFEAFARLRIKDSAVCQGCQAKPCIDVCPAGVYRLDRQGHVMVGYQACLECGSCRVSCPFLNIGWALPRGAYGVAYKLGWDAVRLGFAKRAHANSSGFEHVEAAEFCVAHRL